MRLPLIKVSITRELINDGVIDSVLGEPDHISEEHMERAKKLLGDGSARITSSMDLGDKDFGNGVGIMVSVSISCNQDDRSILKAFELTKELAQEYAVDAFQEGQDIYKELATP